jgi:predicted secreted protein
MMTKILFVLILAFISLTQAFAREHNRIETLGVSKAGQFVALEEYAYEAASNNYVVTVRVINVWTQEYVGKMIKVVKKADRPAYLDLARAEARRLAQDDLIKFKISGT